MLQFGFLRYKCISGNNPSALQDLFLRLAFVILNCYYSMVITQLCLSHGQYITG